MIQKIVTIVMCFALVACGGGLMKDRSDAYLQAEAIQKITIPSAIGSLQKQDLYEIPEVEVARQSERADFLPPGMADSES